MYVNKWSQDLRYNNNVSIKERKEKIHKIFTTSLKISTLPLTKMSILTMSYTNSSPKNDYSHIPILLPLFVTSDKG